ncbi:MAG TPA: ribonuclease III domain-containing protein [Solirubrobacteraceae bacterium]|nr:ribonuclease III domain-containing protein [Solirubrobacteraceae bacterium]
MFTHASWTERRADSYERLAFLGDSVLSLAVSTHLFRQEGDRLGAGRLTKVRAQAVSGRACRRVAERLEVPERLRALAAERAGAGRGGQSADELLRSERVLASITEAIIGAIYLEFGFEVTAPAVVEAFRAEIDDATRRPLDFKSALQELLARRGDVVAYVVTAEEGPPHDRTFSVMAQVDETVVGEGSGRSKQDAEQAAARAAIEALEAAA